MAILSQSPARKSMTSCMKPSLFLEVSVNNIIYQYLYNTALKSGRLIGGLASRDIE